MRVRVDGEKEHYGNEKINKIGTFLPVYFELKNWYLGSWWRVLPLKWNNWIKTVETSVASVLKVWNPPIWRIFREVKKFTRLLTLSMLIWCEIFILRMQSRCSKLIVNKIIEIRALLQIIKSSASICTPFTLYTLTIRWINSK